MNNQTIENQLTNWGKSLRTLPQNSEMLKTQILREFKTNYRPKAKTFSIPWMSLALVGTAVVALIITTKQNPQTNLFVNDGANFATLQNKLATREATSQSAVNINSITGEKVATAPIQKIDKLPTVQNNSMSAPSPSVQMTPSAISGGSAMPALANQDSVQQKITQVTPITEPDLPGIYINPVAPITDSREFTKTSYSAEIKTRNVFDLAGHVQTIIHGFGGRVDSVQTGDSFGTISFAVPADKFDAFKKELVSIAGEKFVKENIQSQNLLPQKQNLEGLSQTAQNNLSDLENNKNQLTNNHNQLLSSLKAQLSSSQNDLNSLQNRYIYSMSQAYDIYQQEQALAQKIQTLQTRINQENSNFQSQTNYIDDQIGIAQKNLNQISTQNQNLVDDVATVNGTINLNFMSIWELINFYVTPGYWTVIILVLLSATAYQIKKRNNSFLLP